MKKVDFIIVGGGISGVALALQLTARNKSFRLFSDPSLSNSSQIAAGMWNPIVFKRVTKSWMVDELIQYMDSFYTTYEKRFELKFFYKKPILRQFSQPNEIIEWQSKKKTIEFSNYLGDFIHPERINKNINPKLGGAFVNHAGFVDVPAFLSAANSHFEKSIIKERFDYNSISLIENTIRYNDLFATHCVFSEGWMIKNNPYFNYLPMVPAKGEILTIKSKELNLKEIANAGCFVLPMGDHLYKVGSTYNWTDLNEEKTNMGKEELIKKLENIIKTKYDILSHDAGVRPSVKDRRPILGKHPKHCQLSVFNGMGTKGIMLAPYFSDHLINHLLKDSKLHSEVDINRFLNKSI